MEAKALQVEVNAVEVKDAPLRTLSGGIVFVTPPLDDTFWLARVVVSKDQAVVAFPKFGQIGIGFQHEDKDWNTNLPYTCYAEKIYNHIRINRRSARREKCITAINALQLWASDYRNAVRR